MSCSKAPAHTATHSSMSCEAAYSPRLSAESAEYLGSDSISLAVCRARAASSSGSVRAFTDGEKTFWSTE